MYPGVLRRAFGTSLVVGVSVLGQKDASFNWWGEKRTVPGLGRDKRRRIKSGTGMGYPDTRSRATGT